MGKFKTKEVKYNSATAEPELYEINSYGAKGWILESVTINPKDNSTTYLYKKKRWWALFLFNIDVSKFADPVKHCDRYKAEGCSHVDGYLCNMDTCDFKNMSFGNTA